LEAVRKRGSFKRVAIQRGLERVKLEESPLLEAVTSEPLVKT
jgi:hypothetical protein